jgi:Tol biopolymer transport system component/DNA-binding winged helix-turn-helix (wHTH) protein
VESQGNYQFGPFLIDVRERVLQRDGQPVALTPKAFDLLAALVEQPGRLISKDELLHKVWPDTFVEESNLAYNVFALRKALGDAAESGLYIETVPKRGYRFTAAVTPVGSEPNARPMPATPAELHRGPLGGDAEAPSATKIDDTVAGGDPPRRAPAEAFRRVRPLAAAVALVLALTLYLAAWSWRDARNAEPRAVPLTSLAGVLSSPSLSPDGRYVVFTWTGPKQDNQDLYVQQIGAGSQLRLTTDPAEDRSASWSPDGNAIAFLRAAPQGQKKEVRLIAPLGGMERKVGDIQPRVPWAGFTLGWCPDSTCVLVTDSTGPGKSDALFAMAIDSGEKRQVTFPPEVVSDVDPAVSPDGRSLIFRRNTTSFLGSFYRVALSDGSVPQGEPVRLTPPLGEGTSTWTRDGREIVFSTNRALWRFDAMKGGTPTRLASVGQDGQGPVIAPTDDGRQRLVYLHSVGDLNVWRVTTSEPGAPASAQPVVAIASTRGDMYPAVSPDGRRMAFVSDRSGQREGARDWQVWVADADGSGAVKLTSMAFRTTPASLSWSPDGASIAFGGDPEGRADVFVVPASGGRPRIPSAKLSHAVFPRFSRDGRWIYFCSAEGQVWKMPATGGDAVKVTNGPAGRPIESADGRDLYYAPNLSELWRLPLAGGAPVKVLDGVINYHFAVVERGIYYLERVSDSTLTSKPVLPAGPGGQTRLQYFDFATGRSTTVARDLGLVGFAGLSASPDGRHVFFGRADSFVDELMVVDDFR